MLNAKVKQPTRPGRTGVDRDVVFIGKDVIELLTSGMYVSPITIFREYVQNAADGIDELGEGSGCVTISIDHSSRSVSIRDSGAAIPRRHASRRLLSVGGSTKRGTEARGFRGVGRLSGLAYCKELEFRSKAPGEDEISCFLWDCRNLRARLADPNSDDDLKTIIASSVTSWNEAGDPADHFFQVTMRDMARHRGDLLLNEKAISQYLGQVAPVAFSPDFEFGRLIERRLAEFGARAGTVDLTINGQAVHRLYRDAHDFPGSPHSLRIKSVDFFEMADVDGHLGAVAWIAHHEYVRGIPAALGIRGLRARAGNIQVGEPTLFDDVFREPRFNGWTIGEVHVLDRRIVPNGRRDDFEMNHHAYNLLAQLDPLATNVSTRCRNASVGRTAETIIVSFLETARQQLDEPTALDGTSLTRLRASLQRAKLKLRRITNNERRSELETALDEVDRKLRDKKPQGAPTLGLKETKALVMKMVTNRSQAKALIEALNGLCAL